MRYLERLKNSNRVFPRFPVSNEAVPRPPFVLETRAKVEFPEAIADLDYCRSHYGQGLTRLSSLANICLGKPRGLTRPVKSESQYSTKVFLQSDQLIRWQHQQSRTLQLAESKISWAHLRRGWPHISSRIIPIKRESS